MEPKSYNHVTVSSDIMRHGLLIPYDALDDQGAGTVFVCNKNDRLERRQVKLGAVSGKNAEVVFGLEPGEILVTSSLEGLQEGMKVKVDVTDYKRGEP